MNAEAIKLVFANGQWHALPGHRAARDWADYAIASAPTIDALVASIANSYGGAVSIECLVIS